MEYEPAAWNSFFSAASTATGVLLGLMIAAVTVRHTFMQDHVIAGKRVFRLLIVLFDLLIYTLFPLAPIGPVVMGALLALTSFEALEYFYILLIAPLRPLSKKPRKASTQPPSEARSTGEDHDRPRPKEAPKRDESRLRSFRLYLVSAFPLVGPISMVVCGASLAIGSGGGFYWALPGIMITLGSTLGFLWQVIVSPRPLDAIR